MPSQRPPPPPPADIGVLERIVSASCGALLTNLLTTPLDVVKTRMQTTPSVAPVKLTPSAATCMYYPVCKDADQAFLRSACIHTTARRPIHTASAMSTLVSVARKEGAATLWSGLTPGLILAIPSTTIYFTAYDELRHALGTRYPGSVIGTYAPLFAGMISRTATVAMTSPLELLRTKAMQQKSSATLLEAARAEVASGGVSALWRGLSPTLWRDVPFSGLYWLLVDRVSTKLKARLAADHVGGGGGAAAAAAAAGGALPPPQPTFSQTFSIAFISGLVAGAVSAIVTTPFDVVKTRRQVQWQYECCHENVHFARTGTFEMLRMMAKEEGARGLFAGVGARVAKVAPACAIMIGSYELGKRVFARLEDVPME